MKCGECHFYQMPGLSKCRAWPEEPAYPHIGCERHPFTWWELGWHILRVLRTMQQKYPEPDDKQKSRYIDRLIDLNMALKYTGNPHYYQLARP